MKITVLSDIPDSWILPYADGLVAALIARGHEARLVRSTAQVEDGDLMFLIGCGTILTPELLARHRHNLVVHESDLPRGRGWSPLTWQILEGQDEIPITLFEAEPSEDRGPIYFQDVMRFGGHELVDELRAVQGRLTVELCLRFVDAYPDVKARPQRGSPTRYPRRRTADSRVETDASLKEIFPQLRVADNERYPVYFDHAGCRYILKIYKLGPKQSVSTDND